VKGNGGSDSGWGEKGRLLVQRFARIPRPLKNRKKKKLGRLGSRFLTPSECWAEKGPESAATFVSIKRAYDNQHPRVPLPNEKDFSRKKQKRRNILMPQTLVAIAKEGTDSSFIRGRNAREWE